MAATSVFQRVRTGSKIGAQYDQEGNLIKVETREDEEQSIKLAEILELLLAAGYFRARIKGLSPFDKVVGGMTWCITTCNFDIDVDLLFQENSTIGQKIALTEKIVSVLPKMKCPHRLEPHQIQGLDFIHIFPVIQWLVKKAIETREEMGDYVRSYSISQFQKTHAFPEDEEFALRKERAISTVVNVSEVYAPQRRYKRQEDAGDLLDEESRVHSTLLEFGSPCLLISQYMQRYGFSKQSKAGTAAEQKQVLAQGTQAAPPGMTNVSEEEDLQAAEELKIKALMTGMAAMATEERKLSASTVGQIVGMQSEEIKQIVTEYAEKAERSAEDRPERFGPAQQHRRQLASLNKQIVQKTKELEELQVKQQEVRAACEDAKSKLAEATTHTEKLEKELSSLEEVESEADSGLLEKLRALVSMNENLKHQEQTFRSHCREEMTRLQQNIEELKMEYGDDGDDKKEMNVLIDQQYGADREKLQKIRLLMARRNREIAILQRKIDEVPSRAELTQYQKRFIELYSQVSATHKETKQFFTLYNTLDDKKVYLEKEVNLLNSIHDHFQQAMASSGGKEQFLRQMEQIVEGIKQSRIKMEKKRQENKMRRDQLNDEYLELLDKQRLYFKTVKDFKEECRKNEMLLSKLRAKGAS
ncbi:coiled-coil domain-containing protein 93 isoform X1 [Misgurnus anguillicaudatus]|uniref:coiled-coil domain-containing protein 93 isoform X1 n=1 Tax=Misgurnus anguillicaudatus TaxID=75329 RepID=UPI0024357C0D|nr:coiled-coil domain-containing protein 93 isoform X1 [Misgurnus anguillicaudatus]